MLPLIHSYKFPRCISPHARKIFIIINSKTMKHALPLFRSLVLTMILAMGLASVTYANVTVTAATGGTNISADKSLTAPGSGTYTALTTSIVISDNFTTDFKTNQTNVTFVLTAPANWNFKAGVGTVVRAGSYCYQCIIVVTATTITVTYTTG